MQKNNPLAAILTIGCPSEIPEWFKFEPLPYTIHRPSLDDIAAEHREEIRQWQHDPIYDLPDHLMWYQEKCDAAYDHRKEIDRLNKENKFFAWRAYYAKTLYEKIYSK